MATSESTEYEPVPTPTDECVARWAEHTGLDRHALELCLADPERQIVEKPPRWSGLSASSASRFLISGGGEACFVLVSSEIPGGGEAATTCVIRNRSMLARGLPAPAPRRALPLAIIGVVVAVVVLAGVAAYLLLKDDDTSGPAKPKDTSSRGLLAASLAADQSKGLQGVTVGRARLVHARRGSRPREVCAVARRGGRALGRYCVEIEGTSVVSRWVVPRGDPDRDRFRVFCTGVAREQNRCTAKPLPSRA
jgi:hypothetical protein